MPENFEMEITFSVATKIAKTEENSETLKILEQTGLWIEII